MRKQFVVTMEQLFETDRRLVLLLGDIGVFGFRNVSKSHPSRVYNVGVCEQAMTGMAAGLAKEGFIPVLHSIAPFVVERCLEQIKNDLCYQDLKVRIVSVGASYDYAALGCTHHCPGDVSLLRALPNMQIMVPGTPTEFDRLFRASYGNDHPAYIRLSEQSNNDSFQVEFGRAHVLRVGSRGTVIAVGPMLSRAIDATNDLDVTLLYYTTIAPFDARTLRENHVSSKVAVFEPFYEGTLAFDVAEALRGKLFELRSMGVPHQFLTNYGHTAQHDLAYGLTGPQLKKRLEEFLDAEQP